MRGLQRQQRGSVMVLVTIAILSILGIAGLALDSGHAMLNKSRLQNALDAAALNGARQLNQTQDAASARTVAVGIFIDILAGAGNAELKTLIKNQGLVVEFSPTLNPFTGGEVGAKFVRVKLPQSVSIESWLSQIFGQAAYHVSASSVAGPSPVLNTICSLAPMMLCGDPADTDGIYGYEVGQNVQLKLSAGQSSDVGPGNFQLIRLDENDHGGADVRMNLASDFGQCVTLGESIQTEPGNKVGPTYQGLNTRFGQYTGPFNGSSSETNYPPDVVTDAPMSYSAYQNSLSDSSSWDFPINGRPGRRVMAVPVGDCTQTVGGASSVPILGTACVFLTQPTAQQGNQQFVNGEIINGCQSNGLPGPNPGTGPGIQTIQLYEDPARWDT